MFERLFELFLHAKTGVIAGVFLVGTTGALVTATVQNGVTTITITQTTPSPSGSANISASVAPVVAGTATASPSVSPSVSPSASGTATASPSSSPSSHPNCKSQAQTAAEWTKTVDQAFAKFHTDLMRLRELNKTDAARKTVEDADKQLKQLRQNAVKAIHAATACFRRDDDRADKDQDEDKDEDNDEQENDHAASVTVTVSASPTPSPAVSPTPSAPPATDPKTIATQAVAAMKLVFDTAVAQLPPTTTAAPRVRVTERPDRTRRPDPSPKKEGDRD